MKRNYKLISVLTLALTIAGSVAGYALPSYGAEYTDAKIIQAMEQPKISTRAVYDQDKYKLPDEEEINANKKLKEVMEQWDETGEYPDYFADCVFLGRQFLYPVIQLTDVSEETKQDFIQRVGLEHEKWQFLEVSHSRKDLTEFMAQVEADFGDDKRVEKIILPAIGKVQDGQFYILSEGDYGKVIEFRPEANEAEILKIWILVHNEYEAEMKEVVEDTYMGNNADKVDVSFNSEDRRGNVITEEKQLPEGEYRRQYRINDIRDEEEKDIEFKNIIGDANGNNEIDIEDAQLMLKEALKIKDKFGFRTYFYYTFLEDYKTIKLSDVQEILKRALKIESDISYAEHVNTFPLYECLESGSLDKSVENKVLKGKEALMEYVETLDNPQLEAYLDGIAQQYVDDETFLVQVTPVYSEEMRDSENGLYNGYCLKKLPDADVLLVDLVDQNYQRYNESASKDQYFTTINVIKDSMEDEIQEDIIFVNESTTLQFD